VSYESGGSDITNNIKNLFMSQDQNQQPKNSVGTPICVASLDIRQVSELKQQFLDALGVAQPVTIQAQDIERADTAGLQLLTAFFIDARAKGIRITWDQPSKALLQSARLIGVAGLLELDDDDTH
jgi:anti-anti-sigma regulatory factor